MHYCLNIVTEQKDYPAAILIRGVENVSGPGRVTKYFGIDKGFHAKRAVRASGCWIEDKGIIIKPRRIGRGKRIGVDYAGKWKDKKWRFFIS
jgi:DNA-3-methyladenine glycosylase